ncbi:MAG: hypothetical protein LC778_12120, partial [Acidobacteria bacterium]|nr:hypothetical protein [Acidobacteriota bacterium]
QPANLSKNQRQQIERNINKTETKISELEKKLRQLSFQISEPEIIADHLKLRKVSENVEQTERQIQNLYTEWENLVGKLNG